MGPRTLVAFDTDHIKQYVFATNKLKEIRGASSLLDHLNRRAMNGIFPEDYAKPVYTNGGSAMFLVEDSEEKAREFGEAIRRAYLEQTHGGATISFNVQAIPEDIDDVWHNKKVHPYMRLLHYRLLVDKGRSHQNIEVLPSHPFMSPCDACGVRYAEGKYSIEEQDEEAESPDPDDQERRYCGVCLKKRGEDNKVRKSIRAIIKKQKKAGQESVDAKDSYIWEKIISLLLKKSYDLPNRTNRPTDFNKLEGLSGGRDYMALIYADANHMGTIMDDLETLEKRNAMAEMVDNAIYTAMSQAIVDHLPVVPGERKGEHMFPFDILMIGGDDVMVVTPANVAMDVALTLGKAFRDETKKNDIRPGKPGCTLSIAVILAPIKYPFGLLHELAESTLKYAKKEGAKREEAFKKRQQAGKASGTEEDFDQTIINFVVVAGNTGSDFDKVMESLSRKNSEERAKFYATARPYSVTELEQLRTTIRDGKGLDLGHTKLHQLREAVMKKNATSAVSDARAVLTSWRKENQVQHVSGFVYQVAASYLKVYQESGKLEFPHLDFPWFRYKDGDYEVYRSPLLDLVELYDFITPQEQKGGKGGA